VDKPLVPRSRSSSRRQEASHHESLPPKTLRHFLIRMVPNIAQVTSTEGLPDDQTRRSALRIKIRNSPNSPQELVFMGGSLNPATDNPNSSTAAARI